MRPSATHYWPPVHCASVPAAFIQVAPTFRTRSSPLSPSTFVSTSPCSTGKYVLPALRRSSTPSHNLENSRHIHENVTSPVNMTAETFVQPLSNGIDLEIVHSEPSLSSPSSVVNEQPIVFFHGSKNAAFCYRNFQAYFSNNDKQVFESFAVTFRGYGNSRVNDDSVSSFTIDDCVNDINLLFKECPRLQGKKPFIVAHSLGGYTIQKWILSLLQDGTNVLDRISGVCLMCSTPPSGNSQIVTRTLFALGPFISWDITRALVTEALTTDVKLCKKVFFTDADEDEQLKELMPLFTQNLKINVRSVVPFNDKFNQAMVTDGMTDVPFLVIGGKKDVIVDEPAIKEIQNFWNSDMMMINDAPHELVLYHNWESVCTQLNEWILTKTASKQKS